MMQAPAKQLSAFKFILWVQVTAYAERDRTFGWDLLILKTLLIIFQFSALLHSLLFSLFQIHLKLPEFIFME